jgi:hypothetical protein
MNARRFVEMINVLAGEEKTSSSEEFRRQLRERFLEQRSLKAPQTHAGNAEILAWLRRGSGPETETGSPAKLWSRFALPVFMPAIAATALVFFSFFVNRNYEWLVPADQKVKLSQAVKIHRLGFFCCNHHAVSETAIASKDLIEGGPLKLRTDFGLAVETPGGTFSFVVNGDAKDVQLREGEFLLGYDHSYSGKRGIQLPSGYRVSITGTRLYIDVKKNKFEVYLIEGSSHLTSPDGLKAPMEKGHLYSSENIAVAKKINPAQNTALLRRFGVGPVEEGAKPRPQPLPQKTELPWIAYTAIESAGSERSLSDLNRLESVYPHVYKIFLRSGVVLYLGKKNNTEEVYYTITNRSEIPRDEIVEVVRIK